jgi:hypothetical protein
MKGCVASTAKLAEYASQVLKCLNEEELTKVDKGSRWLPKYIGCIKQVTLNEIKSQLTPMIILYSKGYTRVKERRLTLAPSDVLFAMQEHEKVAPKR